MLGDRNDSCIIENTPQLSETAGTRGRALTIRANPAQTALLRTAYEDSNVISAGQAKILAQEIGLPPKWILQWFSRQRTKDRKNDVNYKPRAKISTFSAAFFSDSGSGALATGTLSAQEIIAIKSEYQDATVGSLTLASTPSVSGSTSLEEFQTPLLVTESSPMSTSGSDRLEMVFHGNTVIQTSGTGMKKGPTRKKKRNILYPGRKLKHALDLNTPTKPTGSAGFRLLKSNSPGATTYGLSLSDGAQSVKTEPDMDAYTQLSSPPMSKECRDAVPSGPQIHLPHIVPPQRSPIVTPDNAIRSAGRESKTRHRPSKLSVVNAVLGDSDISLLEEDPFSIPISTVTSAAETFSHKNMARSVFQTQWYNNRLSMSVPRDRHAAVIAAEARVAEPVLCSKYLVPTAVNLLKANPPAAVASSSPDSVELAFMDNFTETFSASFSDLLSSIHHNWSTGMESGFSERYDRRAFTSGHPSTASANAINLNPDLLEALDPLRAPLKHLTSILAEYRDDDGTYRSLLVGLTDPARRRKIVECLSNEELISHDPFSAAMGISLLSRLGVL